MRNAFPANEQPDFGILKVLSCAKHRLTAWEVATCADTERTRMVGTLRFRSVLAKLQASSFASMASCHLESDKVGAIRCFAEYY